MAKLTKNILGNISGSVGSISYSRWNDLTVVKSKRGKGQFAVSDARKLVQEKFRIITLISKAFFRTLKIGFAVSSGNQSERNAFLSRRYPAISGTPGNIQVDY